MLGLWALDPAAAIPWAMDLEAATQGAVDPVASDLSIVGSLDSLPCIMGLDSSTQNTWLLQHSNLLVIDQSMALPSRNLTAKSPYPYNIKIKFSMSYRQSIILIFHCLSFHQQFFNNQALLEA